MQALHPKARAEFASQTESRGRRTPLARSRRQIEEACRAEYPGMAKTPYLISPWVFWIGLGLSVICYWALKSRGYW